MLGTKKLIIHNDVINTFFKRQSEIAYFSSTYPIRTSNLKYDIFEDVCLLIGIDINTFHNRYREKYNRNLQKTIDNDLVDKRNYIAHGEYLPITEQEYKDLYDVIVNGILYTFKELVIDSAINKLYLRFYAKIRN